MGSMRSRTSPRGGSARDRRRARVGLREPSSDVCGAQTDARRVGLVVGGRGVSGRRTPALANQRDDYGASVERHPGEGRDREWDASKPAAGVLAGAGSGRRLRASVALAVSAMLVVSGIGCGRTAPVAPLHELADAQTTPAIPELDVAFTLPPNWTVSVLARPSPLASRAWVLGPGTMTSSPAFRYDLCRIEDVERGSSTTLDAWLATDPYHSNDESSGSIQSSSAFPVALDARARMILEDLPGPQTVASTYIWLPDHLLRVRYPISGDITREIAALDLGRNCAEVARSMHMQRSDR